MQRRLNLLNVQKVQMTVGENTTFERLEPYCERSMTTTFVVPFL